MSRCRLAKSISFSTCGSFLDIQRDFPVGASPIVIPCPEEEEDLIRDLHFPAALPSPRFVDDEIGDSEAVQLSETDGQTPAEEERRVLSRKGPRLLLKKETV